MKLRPYQLQAVKDIRAAFEAGINRIMLCSPTGSGKTVTFAHIASEAVKAGSKVIVIVDRHELLQQAKDKLTRYGLNPSIITNGRKGRLGAESYVATVQTLIRRTFPDVDLIIIDEAHKQTFDKLFEREAYKDKFVIAPTATPYRSGKMKQLSDLYGRIITTVSIQELIKDGFLVPAITYGVKMDMSGVKVKGGDFDDKEMFAAFNKPKLYSGVVEKYKHFANGTKAICFCVNVEHSKLTCKAFNEAGISAYHVDGKTPPAEREKLFAGHKAGFFQVLCNVDIATTGYDDWSIETIIVDLSTMSLPKWLQMAGRGGRPTDNEFIGKPGYLQKSHFNLIDMGGNVHRLGFWEQDREFSLTHKTKEKLEAAPVKECPEDETDDNNKRGCGALIPAPARKCKFCGFEFPAPKPTPLAEGEFLTLEYREAQLPPELVGKAQGSMTIEELEKLRVHRGYKLGWVIKHILLRSDLSLKDYEVFRNFKPGWAEQMEKIHVRQTIESNGQQ